MYNIFQGFQGIPEFMAITISEDYSPNRRTDLEELMYTSIFLLKKTLPWSNIKGKYHADTCRKMCNKKKLLGLIIYLKIYQMN